MRHSILFIAFIVSLFSCSRQNNSASEKPDHVSQWFLLHEDSLYQEFMQLSKKGLKGLDENKFSYVSNHQPPNTLMAQLTNQVKKYCDSLEVTFTYTKTSTPKATILISTGYDRRWSKALDTIFNYVPKPKHFKIVKYEPCFFDSTTDILSLDIGDVALKDFRVIMMPFDTLQNITVYIAGKPKDTKLPEEDYDFLRQDLFGEELFVRKINKLDFKFCDTIKGSLLTIYETRNRLK
jgi:hypothetical protein